MADAIASPPSEQTSLIQAIKAYLRVVELRKSQYLRIGDAVLLLTDGRVVSQRDPAYSFPPNGSVVGLVDSVKIELIRDVFYEVATVASYTHKPMIGRRVMPGTADTPFLPPCCRPGCTSPHSRGRPWCQCDDPSSGWSNGSREDPAWVRARIAEEEVLLETIPPPYPGAGVTEALMVDLALLKGCLKEIEYRQHQKDGERRQQERAERVRQKRAAEKAVQDEIELLRRLMEKHGVAAHGTILNAAIEEGQRHLDL